MCGIAGVVGTSPPEDELLARMAGRMVHRGPDSQAVWHDGYAGLAVRRLAVIDLDQRSNQPFHLGAWHLVFNGEIYNYREIRDELRARGHRFETEGDGEVLLHAWAEWGEAALDRLNGMFALALWHDQRRELTCARDPFGEKPLFWAERAGEIVFASEVRALLEARPDLGAPRFEAVAPYLGLGLMPPVGESFFAEIRSLPAAHLLHFAGGRIDVKEYWRPRRISVPGDYHAAAAELRELLFDAVRMRLRSDVPVGTSLSGGVDSSAVVCLAGQIAGDHQRHAFTARFRGFERDEWGYAEVVARAAGVIEHHAVEPTASELLEELEPVARFQEEPFGSSSIYAQWRVMRAARDQDVTVLLDGQGADELFGGYPGSNGWALRSEGTVATVRGLARSRDRAGLVRALGSDWMPTSLVHAHRYRRTTPYASRLVRNFSTHVEPPRTPVDGLESPLAGELLRQAFHTSLPALLRYADRNSMAHSREVRLPYLDRRVAEFALSLPPDFLYRGGMTKAVLREAVRGLVPPEVLARRDKVGYETPQAQWLSEPAFLKTISEVLLDPRARARDLYVPRTIEADARAGRWRDPQGIWRTLNLELWLQAFERSPANIG
jgi:asparagine synthase (glutamine-hydrolysing)